MPQAETLTAATSLSNDLTVTGYSVPASDERAGRFLFQPHAGASRVPDKSLLDLLMLGGDVIGKGREAEQVVRDGVVNGRVGFEGVRSRDGLFRERYGDRGDCKGLQDVASGWGHGYIPLPRSGHVSGTGIC